MLKGLIGHNYQWRPIEARVLVMNFAASADVTRASYTAAQL
jgi:hypothetical protein